MARPVPVVRPVDAPGPTPEEVCADGVLTVAAFARFCGLRPPTARKVLAAREVVSFRIGSRRVVPRAAAVRWLADQMRDQWEGGR